MSGLFECYMEPIDQSKQPFNPPPQQGIPFMIYRV